MYVAVVVQVWNFHLVWLFVYNVVNDVARNDQKAGYFAINQI